MPEPPYPVIPVALLAYLARLAGWQPIDAKEISDELLGYFLDPASATPIALFLDAGERWGVYPVNLPGLGPFAVSQKTAEVLFGATLAEDGALIHGGKRFRLQALLEAGHLTASLVHAEVTRA